MCGIVGEVNLNKNKFNRILFKKNIDKLKNRGPDSTGYWSFQDKIQFGFARLSVIDLKPRSNQPMIDKEKKNVIMFNGEIYNYIDIKKYLKLSGYKFNTSSDTEVILNLYKKDGDSGLKKLKGMFSIVIFDIEKKKIIFLRDPLGIKPLYYSKLNNKILFCSTVKGLINFPEINKEVCSDSLNFFLAFGYIKENKTIFKKIKSFEPGVLYELNYNCKLTKKKLFTVKELFFKKQSNFHGNLAETFKQNLTNHCVGDVKIALLLSSGLDSSVLLDLLNKAENQKISAFTIGFQEYIGTNADETDLSKKFCKFLGIKNKIKIFKNSEILNLLTKFFDNMDQPSYDGLNTFLVTKVISNNNFKVGISGLGSDEIFIGYNTFMRMRLLNWFRVFYNNFLFKLIFNCLSKIMSNNKYVKFMYLLSIYNSPYQIYLLLRSKKQNLCYLNNKALRKIFKNKHNKLNSNMNYLTSYFEIEYYMKNQLLKDADWASMANSVELRVPFVDYSFLKKFVRSGFLGIWDKIYFFKLLTSLPKFILRKKKTGFQVPYHNILKLYNFKNKTSFKNWSELCIYRYFKSMNLESPILK